MENSSFVLTFASILTLFILIKLLITNKTKKHKNLPPSPPSLPIIGHLHLLKNPLHRTLSVLADSYGPVLLLRFGSRRVLVVSSPSVANECFTTNDLVFANRPQFKSFKLFHYNYTTLIIQRYGPQWRNSRRIATVDVLSTHRILSFTDVRADEVQSLARLLIQKHAVLDKDEYGFAKVELKSNFFELSMNIMLRMLAGKRYYGEGNEISEEASRFIYINNEAKKLVSVSNPGDFLPLLGWLDYNGVQKKLKKLHEIRDKFLDELIDEVRNEQSDKQNMIGVKKTMLWNLLELQKTDPENYSDTDIKGLFTSLLQAGTNTTSDTIEWAMSLLLNNPESLNKLRDEIDNHVGNERLLSESDIANLPYLENVVNETLRLQPVAALLLPHESSSECVVDGYDIPSETMLMVNAYAIQRDPKVWKEPLKFMPERFEDKENIMGEGMIKSWMIPFGMGRRKCIGEGLAMKVISLTVGTLVQCFDLKRVDDVEVDMSESGGIIQAKAIPLEAMYRPRPIITNMVL